MEVRKLKGLGCFVSPRFVGKIPKKRNHSRYYEHYSL